MSLRRCGRSTSARWEHSLRPEGPRNAGALTTSFDSCSRGLDCRRTPTCHKCPRRSGSRSPNSSQSASDRATRRQQVLRPSHRVCLDPILCECPPSNESSHWKRFLACSSRDGRQSCLWTGSTSYYRRHQLGNPSKRLLKTKCGGSSPGPLDERRTGDAATTPRALSRARACQGSGGSDTTQREKD